MPRKLLKIKFIFVAILALFTLILIYFLFYQSFNNSYDEFIVVKAVEPYDDDEISVSNLVNFTNFQYKIKPDSLCNNFEDELLGKALHNFFNQILFLNVNSVALRCYYCNIVCWS